jgi:transposase-like protein
MKESQKQVKYCPRCGSENLTIAAFFKPSIWVCLDCGYEGALTVEDRKLAEKIRERFAHALEELGNEVSGLKGDESQNQHLPLFCIKEKGD